MLAVYMARNVLMLIVHTRWDREPGFGIRDSGFDWESGVGNWKLELGVDMSSPSSEVPYGALDLMVLKTLDTMGAQHGYGIARRIEQMAEGMLALNQGTIYPALLRLEQKGWIESDWGISENNRRARFYSITRAGRKQLAIEADLWSRTVAMMSRMLGESSS
jgi:PadR family transcriptional regulator, regulatory protein PadR